MLVLPAELTHVQAVAGLDMLRRAAAAEDGPQVLVDATALVRFDSSALAVLLGLRRRCVQAGQSLAVRGMTERLRTLAGLYGVSDLLPDADDGAAPAPAAP